jgi:hypothetical protein
MKFIILVSNLKEISPSVFSWKKTIYKKLRCNSTVKIRFGRKKILNYAYVLKNGVGRYNIFFNFHTKLAESSFLCRFHIESVNVFVLPRFDLCHVLSSSTNNFAHAQTLSRMSSLSCRMNIARVYIVFFTGFKKIKQRRISFVLGYLRMILWTISTTNSIKHRILATFNIKKINSDSLYAFKTGQ